ncbi:MAG: IS21 family transposase, partial [Gammaproteobacteria bacterium]
PHAHREHAEWSPARLIAWAEKTGPTTARMVAEILHRRRHPEQGYRACLGLMRLGRHHGPERLEAACAERFLAYSYRAVKNILTAGLDRLPLEELDTPTAPRPVHENIRGAVEREHAN